MITGFGQPEKWLRGRRWVVVLVVVLYLAVAYVLIVENLAWMRGRAPDWWTGLGPMFGAFIGTSIGTRIRLRRVATPEMWEEYRESVRTGVLPPGAESSDWPPMLADRLKEQRQTARVHYVVGGLLVAAWLALLIGHRMGGWIWPEGAGLVLVVVLALRAIRWQRQRLEGLQEQLDARL